MNCEFLRERWQIQEFLKFIAYLSFLQQRSLQVLVQPFWEALFRIFACILNALKFYILDILKSKLLLAFNQAVELLMARKNVNLQKHKKLIA